MGKFVGLAGAVTAFGALAYLMTPLPPSDPSAPHAPAPTSQGPAAAPQHVAIVQRRPPPAPAQSATAPRAEPAAMLIQQIQTELKRTGCYAGAIDGTWSQETQRAMADLGERVSVLRPVDTPDYIMLALARAQSGPVCVLKHQRADNPARSLARWTALVAPTKSEPAVSELKPTSAPSRVAMSEPPPPRQATRTQRGSPAVDPAQRSAAREPVVDPAEVARIRAAREELNRINARNRTTVAAVQPPASVNSAAAPIPVAQPVDTGRAAAPLADSARMGLGAPAPDPLTAGIDPRDPHAPAILRGMQQPAPAPVAHAGLRPGDTAEAPTSRAASPPPATTKPPQFNPQVTKQAAKKAWMRTVFSKMKFDGP